MMSMFGDNPVLGWLKPELFPAETLRAYLDVDGTAVVKESDGVSVSGLSRMRKP
jgi:hypothetical protein